MGNSFVKRALIRFVFLGRRHILKYLPDKIYLQLISYLYTGKKLNFDNPLSYNEKLNWLKIYDRNPLYTQLVDKYEVRKYVAEKIGQEHLVPLLGVWDHFDEIDFSELPDKFALKCTHDSGNCIICRNRKEFDIQAVRKKINQVLHYDYFIRYREWPYKNVKPRIIADAYIEDKTSGQLIDYKFYCFGGEVKLIAANYDKLTSFKRNLYTPDWKYIQATYHFPTDCTRLTEPPELLEEMILLAKKLSQGIPHVRVDFYQVDGKVLFGELTFFPTAGFSEISPEELSYQMGRWIRLPDRADKATLHI